MQVVGTGPDERATAALLDAYFAERAAGFPVAGGYRTTRPDGSTFASPGAFLRVDLDGVAVACGGVRLLPPADQVVRMEVKHLYVVPEARGRGLGRVLLGMLEERARAAGAGLLVLDTNRSLEAAGGLYRGSGFAPVPPYNDNPNATDWYAKALS